MPCCRLDFGLSHPSSCLNNRILYEICGCPSSGVKRPCMLILSVAVPLYTFVHPHTRHKLSMHNAAPFHQAAFRTEYTRPPTNTHMHAHTHTYIFSHSQRLWSHLLNPSKVSILGLQRLPDSHFHRGFDTFPFLAISAPRGGGAACVSQRLSTLSAPSGSFHMGQPLALKRVSGVRSF